MNKIKRLMITRQTYFKNLTELIFLIGGLDRMNKELTTFEFPIH